MIHAINRRRFLGTASALVGSSYLGASQVIAAPDFAAKPSFNPEAVILTWQQDPTTTMTVQWVEAESAAAPRTVWFAKEGSMEWREQPATARPFPMMKLKIHRAELTGLEPGAHYRFRIGLDSAERRFRTMPAKMTEPITFISGGDAGVGGEAKATNAVAANQSPQFVFIGGDLAYENGMIPRIFLQFLKNYSEQMIDPEGRTIPLVACLGNHEVRGGYGKPRGEAPFFYSMFDGLFPDAGHACLDFGDYLSMVILDSNHTTPIEGDQTSWLDKTLKDREDRPNVMAFYHVPSYPSYRDVDLNDEEGGTGAASRKHWVPLFERYNIDAVCEHHDHTFKRTHPLLDGRVDPDGIVYLGDGSWGKLRTPKTPKERPYLAVTHEAYHMTLHRIEGEQRFHIALSDKGKVVDVCTTTKRSRMKGTNSRTDTRS